MSSLQMAVETEPALHLLYTDSILSLKSSLFNKSEMLLNLPSVIYYIMEIDQISSVHFTFGTLVSPSIQLLIMVPSCGLNSCIDFVSGLNTVSSFTGETQETIGSEYSHTTKISC